jgi:hypothetical protein
MRTELRVVEPADGDSLTRGVVYVAPADCHMRFEHDSLRSMTGLRNITRDRQPRRDAGLLDVTAAGGLSLVPKPSEAEVDVLR